MTKIKDSVQTIIELKAEMFYLEERLDILHIEKTSSHILKKIEKKLVEVKEQINTLTNETFA